MPIILPRPRPPAPTHHPQPAQGQQPQQAPNPTVTAPNAAAQPARNVVTGAGSTPSFWGRTAKFDETTSHELASLWALCACAAVYQDSNTVYEQFKTLTGATSYSVAVAGDELVPKAVWFDYPGFRVLAVRGTSKVEQFELYKSSRVRPYVVTGDWIAPAASDSAYTAAKPGAFAYLFEAFVAQAKPIHDAIKAAYSGGDNRRLYVTGHSLGAAVLDLTFLRMGFELFTARYQPFAADYGVPVNSGYRAYCERFRDNPLFSGGYLFGQPRIGYTNTGARVYRPTSNPNEEDWRAVEGWPQSTADRNLGFWYNQLSTKLRHFFHRGDPIIDVPYTFKGSPWWVWYATKGGASADHELTRGSQIVSYGYELRDENLQRFRSIPTGPADFKDRAEKYHCVDPMIDMTADAMVGRRGAMPAAWSALVNYAKELPEDSFSPTF